MRKYFLPVLFILLCLPVLAQETTQGKEFSTDFQLRSRAEYRNGALSPRNEGDLSTGFINQRSRLNLRYAQENLSLGFSGQYVGVWGQDAQIDKNGRFAVNEAWANLKLGKGFFAKLGRQTLVYDDDRILGSLDWNVADRSHDALKLGYENPSDKLHLILAFNQNDERVIGGTFYAAGAQPYKTMQTAWYQHIFDKTLDGSLIFMNLGMQAGDAGAPKTKYQQTMGFNLKYAPERLNIYGTFYYQSGKTVADAKISAWMAALNISYQIAPAFKIMAASDYLSGDDAGGKYTAFNPLYGTHHKFYGAMDYFYASAFIGGQNPGLWDNQLGITVVPSKISLSANYHYFLTAQDIAGQNNRGLGSEVDLQFTLPLMKDVTLTGGYSVMLGTDAMKAVKGGDPKTWQDWGWISININPKIFVTKW